MEPGRGTDGTEVYNVLERHTIASADQFHRGKLEWNGLIDVQIG